MRTLLAASLLLLMAAVAMIPSSAHADPLDGLRGSKRVLLLFSKSRSLSSLDRQIDLLRELRPELDERDMVVLVTAANDETYNAIGYSDLPRGAARDLLRPVRPGPRHRRPHRARPRRHLA